MTVLFSLITAFLAALLLMSFPHPERDHHGKIDEDEISYRMMVGVFLIISSTILIISIFHS